MAIQILIIGLSQVGASIGLALGEHSDVVRRVGHDRDPNVAKQVEKLGAVDSLAFNLPNALRGTDVVILTEGFEHAQETLKLIAGDLRPGAVILDTTPAVLHMAQFATQTLPAERHYVSVIPVIHSDFLRDHEPDGGLFRGSPAFITAPRGANAEAIKLASDLVGLIGATPVFSDPYELDGLLAAVDILPRLVATALVQVTMDQPGWREGRKLAGREYAQATEPVIQPVETEELGAIALQNRENILRLLDGLLENLTELRADLETNNAPSLREKLTEARRQRAEWALQRASGKWADGGDLPKTDPGVSNTLLGRLFGTGRKPGDGR